MVRDKPYTSHKRTSQSEQSSSVHLNDTTAECFEHPQHIYEPNQLRVNKMFGLKRCDTLCNHILLLHKEQFYNLG